MVAHAFTPFAGVGLILLLAVLPWHLRAKNTAVILLTFWLGIDLLVLFVNSIVWWDNVDIKAKVWCDISTKIVYSGQIGPVCCCLCVLRRLESIASTRVVRSTPRDARRHLIFDLCIGFGVPIIFTALHIVNQGHRFDVVQGMGCLPTVYYTPVAVALNLVPPLLVSLIAVIYGLLALRWFVIRRQQFNAILQASCSHIDRSRYLRLMAMAGTEACVSFPINLATFISKFQYTHKLQPWISWEDTHYDFGAIGQITPQYFQATEDRQRYWRTLELGRWGIVVGTFMLFAFFGTTKEAFAAYTYLPRLLAKKAKVAKIRFQRQPPASPPVIATIHTAWQIDSSPDSEKQNLSSVEVGEIKSTISNQEKVYD
ncbi:a-factor receptor [Tilletia horrida]|uniref:A-factor receptor n=1 Tax=Tilletia horrida TaxID=155126 RepID=A0AAN6G773_9BASI|nr:a-factor receptor [Tilletia horrida]KAK0565559.1 a-factor receptor [Tilletia horrida]